MAIRFSISLGDDIAKKVEKMVDETGMTRSGVIQLCLMDYFKQKEAVDVMGQMLMKLDTIEAEMKK